MKTLERSTENPNADPPADIDAVETPAADHTSKICEIFSVHLTIEVPTIETDLVENGLLDSLAVVDLLMQLEIEFGFTVAFDELDIEDFRTVERIAAYVSRSSG